MGEENTKPSSIPRVIVPALEEILGSPFPVLDDGFIRVIDYLGNDQAIVQAARVSYGAGTKKVSEDRGLIRYLMRHRHTTPFEMAEIKFHIRIHMDAWRQWIRHRTANVNEYSTRYSLAIDISDAQRTPPDEWRLQSPSNMQGSSGFFSVQEGEEFSREERKLQEHARRVYNRRIEKGMAREQARKDLPLSTYTEAYWKIDLHNLLHFLSLRMDPHAQLEIRRYADVIGKEIVAKWVPLTWEAFLDYRINSMTLSGPEIKMLREMGVFDNFNVDNLDNYRKAGFVSDKKGVPELTREGKEVQEKLRKLRGE
ncbi:MAG TPA: FAD-dependent thymidylate synthase [Candidatus Nanoarchaeia archaeon]|nr:FAD-dependent thymidylate synthase [Candidatus Nanoarchaeia archaeon]